MPNRFARSGIAPLPACDVVAAVLAAVLAIALATAQAQPPPAAAGAPQMADKVVVRKGERRMELLREGRTVASYRISLGLDPGGHKMREGDFRTPEGRYSLTRRNTESDYFLSIQISYPNEQDIARARREGVPPGGAIMIHGLPNHPRHPPQYYRDHDWTDGCIAVSNADMVELWLLTRHDTPIEILP